MKFKPFNPSIEEKYQFIDTYIHFLHKMISTCSSISNEELCNSLRLIKQYIIQLQQRSLLSEHANENDLSSIQLKLLSLKNVTGTYSDWDVKEKNSFISHCNEIRHLLSLFPDIKVTKQKRYTSEPGTPWKSKDIL